MIFVTVGSQKFQFDRLLKELDRLVEDGVIQEEIFAQIGASTYEPTKYRFVRFMDRDAFAETMDRCSTVITHGGTGVIIGAVKKGKKVIAVPRLAKYQEHVDDHQLQLLGQFDELNLISVCYEMERLGEFYQKLPTQEFRPYVSNTSVVIESIEEYLQTVKTKKKNRKK